MATIYDVAARAGVSTATVSRWLAGQPVRAAAVIREAVEELGYSPSPMAQGLKSGRRGAIGVVVPDVTNPFFAAVVKGLEQGSRGFGYHMLLANSDESGDLEADILAELTPRVDGFILAPAHEQDRGPHALSEAGVPAVLLDREVSGGEVFDAVLVDNEGGARAAAAHLVSLGHERIAMINGPTDTTPGRGRRAGFLAGLAEGDVGLDPIYDMTGDFREESGRQLTLQLLALPEPPTAIFTANNLMTVGALKALRDMRVRVPDDVSIIGFDDLSLGSLLQPPLTCIARPDVEQGALAMRLLLSRLTDEIVDDARHIVLKTSLLVRGSTRTPSGAQAAEIRRRTRTRSAEGASQ